MRDERRKKEVGRQEKRDWRRETRVRRQESGRRESGVGSQYSVRYDPDIRQSLAVVIHHQRRQGGTN